jgi:hypothetical protein
MYNLLVTSAEGTWEQQSPNYHDDRSRFLEYTDAEVRARF